MAVRAIDAIGLEDWIGRHEAVAKDVARQLLGLPAALSHWRALRSARSNAGFLDPSQVFAPIFGVNFAICPRAWFLAESLKPPDHIAPPVPTSGPL